MTTTVSGSGLAVVCLVLTCSMPARAQSPAWTLHSENDAYPSWGDDDYTNGLRVSVDIFRAVWWGALIPGLRDCNTAPLTDPRPCRRTTILIGQNFYTPHNITVPDVQETERPYSAWLYVGLAARAAQPARLRTAEIQLGTTGKPAHGEWVQSRWHALPFVDAPRPRGWAHQVKQVPGAVGIIATWDEKIAAERRTQGPGSWVFADVVPYYRVTLGNVHDFAATGAIGRFGYNLQRGWAEKINPTAPAAVVASRQVTAVASPRRAEFNVFGGIEARAVAWNALLQHDTYTPRELPSISRGVVDLETGFALGYRRLSGGFRWIWRSPEFDGGRWSRFAGLFVTVGGRVQ